MPAANEASPHPVADPQQQTLQQMVPASAPVQQQGPSAPQGQTPTQSGLPAVGQRQSAATGSADRGLYPSGSESKQSEGGFAVDGNKHRRQGTLDLMQFALHSGTKRKFDAAHGTDSVAGRGSSGTPSEVIGG